MLLYNPAATTASSYFLHSLFNWHTTIQIRKPCFCQQIQTTLQNSIINNRYGK